jgi:hypothetical protein
MILSYIETKNYRFKINKGTTCSKIMDMDTASIDG